jgi:hypothetical protein
MVFKPGGSRFEDHPTENRVLSFNQTLVNPQHTLWIHTIATVAGAGSLDNGIQ